MRKKIDITGLKFGQWTTTGEFYSNHNQHIVWKCICKCGNKQDLLAQSLLTDKNHHCNSCGRIDKKHPMYSLLSAAKKSAKDRGFEFNLDVEYMIKLFEEQNKLCALSGQELLLFSRNDVLNHGKENTASVDRVDSTKGYIKGNIQFVHKWLNIMKLDHSLEEFLRMCCLVTEYNKS